MPFDDGVNGGEYSSARRECALTAESGQTYSFKPGCARHSHKMLFRQIGIVPRTFNVLSPGSVLFDPPANGSLNQRTV